MAGRIRDADIAVVRERSPIEEIISSRVTLRSAGGGNLKGLCPFHDEKTPSFSVSPARGVFHCFGCGVGGDVISFVMQTELLSFTESVEWLAGKAGFQLTYEETGNGRAGPRQPSGRQRLVAAHAAAATFYTEQLASPGAAIARTFLRERGFDADAAERFGCGFAPDGWDPLTKHLLKAGFSHQELVGAGLAKQARSGSLIDRFRRRLLWPIRDLSGDVVGFGARRLFDDDDGPKYLNTPETTIYKKSHVLYGLDLAKRDIARQYQAVVVEGYTDVMACHLAGVTTAVATCGTAFGPEHIGLLRRLLMDQDEFRGEVIFTFDGDSAGQQAALKAFSDDQRFVAQTFIAVSPDGMDPCELRIAHGDAAVRDVVSRREPLIEFALRSIARRYNLDTVEGRSSALRATAPMVAQVKDRSIRPGYTRMLAETILGMDIDSVNRAVGEAVKRGSGNHRDVDRLGAQPANSQYGGEFARPAAEDPALLVERETLRLVVQCPALAGPQFDAMELSVFTHPVYVAISSAVAKAGGASAGVAPVEWVGRIEQHCEDLVVQATARELAVEAPRAPGEPDAQYVGAVLARLQELTVTRQIVGLKSKLQRINPVEQMAEYHRLFGELVALEQHKRGLRSQAFEVLN